MHALVGELTTPQAMHMHEYGAGNNSYCTSCELHPKCCR
jgi:hypothetical protein